MNEKVRNKNVLATQIYTMVMFTSEQNVYLNISLLNMQVLGTMVCTIHLAN